MIYFLQNKWAIPSKYYVTKRNFSHLKYYSATKVIFYHVSFSSFMPVAINKDRESTLTSPQSTPHKRQ